MLQGYQVISDQFDAMVCVPKNVVRETRTTAVIASVDDASASINEDGDIVFVWTDNTGTGTAKANDKVILVAWLSERKEVVFDFSDATRNDGYAILKMNSQTGIVETWLGFLSADGKNAANSVYTGRLS